MPVELMIGLSVGWVSLSCAHREVGTSRITTRVATRIAIYLRFRQVIGAVSS